MLSFKNKGNAFTDLFFACVIDPSGLSSQGSSFKIKADFEAGKVTAFTGSSWYHICIRRVSLSRTYPCPSYLNIIKNSDNLTGPFLAVYIFAILVLEPFSSMFMFPLNYKHPKGKADLNYVFIKPHNPSSIDDRKVAATEGSNCDELDLKQFSEGWRWVIVQVIR